MELEEAVMQCRKRLERNRRPGHKIGEQNTKVMLVEPILAALGWDLYDPEEVNREYRRRSSDNPVDYALLLMRSPRLFVEAKGLGENIADPRWANQVIAYAAVAGVEWVALTDGAEWRIYNAHAPVPVEDKLFRAVTLADDTDEALETLTLLSTENMRENRIHELWRGFFIDRQVNQVLTDIFAGAEPPSELVALVTRRADRLTRGEVRESLIRARATFDWPTPEISLPPGYMPGAQEVPQPQVHPVSPSPQSRAVASGKPGRPPRPGRKRTQKSRVSAEERNLKVADLLRHGRLKPGPVLARYDGKEWGGRIDGHGVTTFQGEGYTSLSAAGAAVKIASRGPGLPTSVLATDGWSFWRATDARAGDTVSLKEIRRRTAADSTAT
jgi:hypothetical protein